MIEMHWCQNQKRQLYFNDCVVICDEKQFEDVNRKAISVVLKIEDEYDQGMLKSKNRTLDKVRGLK